MKKRIVSIICLTLSALMLCSCGNKKAKAEAKSVTTEVFGAQGTSKYVKVGKYTDIVIDKNSNDYKEYYESLYIADITEKNLFDEIYEGAVSKNEYANIDFVGTLDGTPFNGGTSNGYDLLIGSGSFIEGFEDGLIGVNVGETKVLKLKFPDNYGSSELAGKNVEFTVTVNYRRIPKKIEEAYKELGYKTLDEYKQKLDNKCKSYFATKQYIDSCSVLKVPESDQFTALVMMAFYDDYLKESKNIDFAEYTKQNGKTINEFMTDVIDHTADNQIDSVPELKTRANTILAYYALFETEKLQFNESELKDKKDYELCYYEYKQIKTSCEELLNKNAKFK